MPSEKRPVFVDPRHLQDRWRDGLVRVEVKRPRSVQHNALYWSQLHEIVASGATKYPTAEHLHDAIKAEMGYVSPVYRLDGSVVFVPDSTAFEKMTQKDFNAFYERAIELIQTHLGIDVSQLERAA
jgi:hypothetical protein